MFNVTINTKHGTKMYRGVKNTGLIGNGRVYQMSFIKEHMKIAYIGIPVVDLISYEEIWTDPNFVGIPDPLKEEQPHKWQD